MFISPLIEKINAYDPFRIHYCNGLRALVALLSLFVINYFYSINNPYFYFFYIPITCLSLETLGETNIEKAKIYLEKAKGGAKIRKGDVVNDTKSSEPIKNRRRKRIK